MEKKLKLTKYRIVFNGYFYKVQYFVEFSWLRLGFGRWIDVDKTNHNVTFYKNDGSKFYFDQQTAEELKEELERNDRTRKEQAFPDWHEVKYEST